MIDYASLSDEDIDRELERILKEMKSRENKPYNGEWWQAYWHKTHEAWAVRMKPSVAATKKGKGVWIGCFDSREYASSIVDELDYAISDARDKSKDY